MTLAMLILIIIHCSNTHVQHSMRGVSVAEEKKMLDRTAAAIKSKVDHVEH